jgi:hypothetical protein
MYKNEKIDRIIWNNDPAFKHKEYDLEPLNYDLEPLNINKKKWKNLKISFVIIVTWIIIWHIIQKS